MPTSTLKLKKPIKLREGSLDKDLRAGTETVFDL
jgi:hypothetical protein